MRNEAILCLILLSINIGLSQAKLTSGKTYAIVVGVSNYQDQKIAKLHFAHQDAAEFADYLTSKSGGNVPNENIRLLTNEQATFANVMTAWYNIINKVKKNDLLYFYFSGHGDVEGGLYKLGFLLTYDTPHKNYLANAIRIEDINRFTNSLSIEKDVKVVLITDACHSGNLIGSNRGALLAGEQLSKSQNNEIRLASCEPDQKSQEGKAWGGGRGVFSYYLLNGLKGMADDKEDEDGVVTVLEMKSYLQNHVSKDVGKMLQKDQVPMVNGKSFSPLGIVDAIEYSQLKLDVDLHSTGYIASKSVTYKPTIIDQYFENLSKQDFLKVTKYKKWEGLKAKKIISETLELFKSSETLEISNSKWRKKVNKDKTLRREYGERLASEIHNDAQLLLNKYIVNTNVILNSTQSDHQYKELEQCAHLLGTALKLIDNENYLYKVIKVKSHYAKGLAARYKIPFAEDPQAQIEIAMAEQENAMAIEDKAQFIHHEMQMITTITTTGSKKRIKRTIRKSNSTKTRTIKTDN